MTDAPSASPEPAPQPRPRSRTRPLAFAAAASLATLLAALALAQRSGAPLGPASPPPASVVDWQPCWDDLDDLPGLPDDPEAFARGVRERHARALAATSAVGRGSLWQEAREAAQGGASDDSEAAALVRAWARFARREASLARAVRAGDAELTALFLGLGADPSQQPELLEHALRLDRAELVADLLDHGAECPTPLRSAAYAGALAAVRLLLDRGRDPNGPAKARAQEGFRPPLSVAAYEGRVEVVELLLERGADPNLRAGGRAASRALDSALRAYHVPAARRLAIVERLLAGGAEAETRERLDQAPAVSVAMQRALREASPEALAIVARLFAAGATLDPGPEPFDEGEKSFEGAPRDRARSYFRAPPLLAGLTVLALEGEVTRARLDARAAALVELARAARPAEVEAQTRATVNRLAQSTNRVQQRVAPSVVGALQPRALDLRHARALDGEQLARFVARGASLRALHLGYNPSLRPADLASLRPLRALTHLSLDTPLATRASLDHLAQLEGLRSLSLAERGRAAVPAAAIATLGRLRALDLHHTNSAYPDLAFLESLTALEELDLRDTRFPLSELKRLARLPQLRSLALPDRAGDAEVELLLAAAPGLTQLGFTRRSSLSAEGLLRVASFPRLRRLSLDRARAEQLSAAWDDFAAAAPEVEVVEPAAYESALEMISRETSERR